MTAADPQPDATSGVHDVFARECVEVGAPVETLTDRPCPACRTMRALVDLDPDYGSAADGRPNLWKDDHA